MSRVCEILEVLEPTSPLRMFCTGWIKNVLLHPCLNNHDDILNWKYLYEYILGELGEIDKLWRIPPISMKAFIEHPDYLGMGKETFAAVKSICSDMIENTYLEGVMVCGVGSGKSLAYGSRILMFDGTLKEVQNIEVGDLLMGDDSKPRKVLSLGRGREEMFKIAPVKGEPHTVNKGHLLSLKRSPRGKNDRLAGEIVNISVEDYLKKSRKFKSQYKLWRTGVDFPEKKLLIEPYYLGVHLGDGDSHTSAITTPDQEIVDYLVAYAKRLNLSVNIISQRGCKKVAITRLSDQFGGRDDRNILLDYLKHYNLIKNKHVPQVYKANSRKNRLALLAGLIDSYGARCKNNCMSFSNKRKVLCEDVAYLCRSLGFAAYVKERITKCNGKSFQSYRVSISGDLEEIPCKVPHKKCLPRKQKKSVLTTGFKVIPQGVGDYYGVTVDKNALYLLGDFTVTHNSFTAELLSTYMAHKLLCMHEPHARYRLAKDKSIAIINMGLTQTQAKNVVFAGIAQIVKSSAFFARFAPDPKKLEIDFAQDNVLLICGNSKETTPLGLNVYCAVLDEAAFYTDVEGHDVAEEIYTALQRRIVSRFGDDGLIIMISSPRYEEDFIMRKYDESYLVDNIYAIQAPTWKMQDKYQKDKDVPCFIFDAEKNTVLLGNPNDTKKPNVEKSNVEKSNVEKPNVEKSNVEKPNVEKPNVEKSNVEKQPTQSKPIERINKLHETDWNMSAFKFWEIPTDFRTSFVANPEKAKRDFGAVPSLTIEGFFPVPAVIDNFFNKDRKNPFDGKFFNLPSPIPREPYYIHVDLGLNRLKRGGRGDKAGFAMVHHAGFKRDKVTNEELSYVYVDLIRVFEASFGGEVEFSTVRNFIYKLKDAGFNISIVTFDGWQSVDSVQILRSKNIKADYQSVDKTLEPYQALKQLINMKRLDSYYHPILDSELKHLELIKGKKVDHPSGGSKDLADGLCGAVFNCLQSNPKGLGII